MNYQNLLVVKDDMDQQALFKASNTKEYLEKYQPIFVVDDTPCKSCPLWETSFSHGVRRSAVYGRGTGRNGVYLMGEGLGATEVNRGTVFIGDAGELLTRILREVNLYETDCYILNVVRCRPPGNRAPDKAEMAACLATHALKDLPNIAPKIMVVMGNTALKAVLGLSKITERRGIWYDGEYAGHKVKVLPTFHPANVLRKPALYDTVKADFQKVKEALIDSQTPGAPKVSTLPPLSREYLNSKERFFQWMNLLADYPQVPIRCDTETTGLNPWADKIVSNSFVFTLDGDWYGTGFLTTEYFTFRERCIEKLEAEFRRLADNAKQTEATLALLTKKDEEIRAEIKVLESVRHWWGADLNDPEIREVLQKVLNREIGIDYHNSDFDVKMWWGQGYRTKCRIDTLDEHLMIDENSFHNLKFLVTRYLTEGAGYQQEIYDMVGNKGAIGTAPPEVLLKYNLDDTYYTGVLEEHKFTPQVKAEGTWDFFMKHAMPLRRALTRVSWRGVLLDRERVIALSERYRLEGMALEQELFECVNKKFNYNSGPQLAEVLFSPSGLALPIIARTEKGAPATGVGVLAELAKLHPAPAMIHQIRHKKKMLSTYLDGKSWIDFNGEVKDTGGLIRFLDSNNRLHCNFLTSGTISGRLAARDPSLLNIPRDPEIRMNFMAPEGWSFIDKDYSQAELVALAYLADDPGFIEAVNTSDLHQYVLDNLMSKSAALADKFSKLAPKDLRNIAKSVNFRIAYRGGSENLAEQLKLTPEETAQWYEEWYLAYPRIPIWWQAMERQWREYHFIEGIYGRKKHFPLALDSRSEAYFDRLSANFPCQNGVADTTNRAIFRFEEEIDNLYGWDIDKVYQLPGIVLAVHDNIIAEAPDEIVPEINDLLDNFMREALPKLGVQLKVDTHIIKRWGQDEFEKQQAREEKIRVDKEMEEVRR